MKCNYNEDLMLYHYDELSLSERKAFDEHLKECNQCASYISKLKKNMESIKLPEHDLTDDVNARFRHRVYEKIDAKSSSDTFISIWPRLVPIAAISLLMFGV